MGVAFYSLVRTLKVDGWMKGGGSTEKGRLLISWGNRRVHQVASELVPVDKLMFPQAQTMETASEQQKQSKTGMSGEQDQQEELTLVLASALEEAAYRPGAHMTLRLGERQDS